MKFKEKIFSHDQINTSRQWELDLARAVIIFFLALIHVAIECTSDEGLCSGIPYLLDTIIGGPFSAPMYMFVMGVGMCYTRKKAPKDHVIRGLKIFVVGYVLNICRFLIPYSIGYWITGDYTTYVEPLLYKVFFSFIFACNLLKINKLLQYLFFLIELICTLNEFKRICLKSGN